MARKSAFIEHNNFLEILESVTTAAGGKYQDVETVYGDMSRLVVGYLACATPAEINKMYNKVGWRGSANGRAMHEAALAWMKAHHPDRLLVGADDVGS